jgi:hypothetical protein
MAAPSGDRPVFGPDDDGFHAELAGGEWWFTETSWFSFHHAERRLGGWFYTMVRHTPGTVAGGAWVWDDSAHLPWEVLYSSNYTALRLPPDADLRHVTLPTGVSIEVVEPTRTYRLGYDDPGRFVADLTFAARMSPRPLVASGSTFGRAAHFDQIGRMTGTIELHGETIAIDSWSMRDRTWGIRPEDRPRRAAYVTGAGDGGAGFLAVTDTRDGSDRVAYGFVRREGEQRDGERSLVAGERTVVRDPERGWVEEVSLEASDEDGATFSATGRAVSRIVINRHSFIDVNSLVRWEVDGAAGRDVWWGEDQDMWPVHEWSAAGRERRR